MVVVKKQKGESLDKLIARFKKLVIEEDLVNELRNRARFISRGEQKKQKAAEKRFKIKLEKKRNQ